VEESGKELMPLDDLRRLANETITDRSLAECKALAALLYKELGQEKRSDGEQINLLRNVITSVVEGARKSAIVSAINHPFHQPKAGYPVPAAGELLAVDDPNAHFGTLMRARGISPVDWASMEAKNSRGKKPRQLKAGVWLREQRTYSYKAAERREEELLNALLSAVLGHVSTPEVAERIRRRTTSVVEHRNISDEAPSLAGSATEATTKAKTGTPNGPGPVMADVTDGSQVSANFHLPTAVHIHESSISTIGRFLRDRFASFIEDEKDYWAHKKLSGSSLPFSVIISGLAAFSIGVALICLPATGRKPLAVIDWSLQGRAQLMCLSALPMILALGVGDHKRLRRVGASILSLAALVFATAHIVIYHADISQALRIEESALHGTTVLIEDFDHEGPCPQEDRTGKATVSPLTSCQMSEWTLRAGLISPPRTTTMGIFPTGDVPFDTVSTLDQEGSSASATDIVHRYYFVAFFHTYLDTRYAACGLSLDGRVGGGPGRQVSLFFHIVQGRDWSWDDVFGPSRVGLYGEVLETTPSPGDGTAANDSQEPKSLSPKTAALSAGWLPFVRRHEYLGTDYSPWTKLAVYLNGDNLTFFVNDRSSVTMKYSGLRSVYRASVGVLAHNDAATNAANCDFKGLRVMQLPDQ
jgi:hypothetical protein